MYYKYQELRRMNFFLSSQNNENLKHVADSAVVDKFVVQPDLFHRGIRLYSFSEATTKTCKQ